MIDQPASDRQSGLQRHVVRPRPGDLQRRSAPRQHAKQRRQLASTKERNRAGETRMMQSGGEADEIALQAGRRRRIPARTTAPWAWWRSRARRSREAVLRPTQPAGPRAVARTDGRSARQHRDSVRRPSDDDVRRLRQVARDKSSSAASVEIRAVAAACWQQWRRTARSEWPFERRSRKSGRSPAPRRRAESR